MFKRIPEICGASFWARSRFAMAASHCLRRICNDSQGCISTSDLRIDGDDLPKVAFRGVEIVTCESCFSLVENYLHVPFGCDGFSPGSRLRCRLRHRSCCYPCEDNERGSDS